MPKRKNYAKIEECYKIPNLLEIQTDSYKAFLQADVPKSRRTDDGLESAFREIFPIESPDGEYKLEYLYYKQKNRLLQIARESITSYVKDKKRKNFTEADPILSE